MQAKRLTEIEALKAGSDSIYAGHNDDDEGEEVPTVFLPKTVTRFFVDGRAREVFEIRKLSFSIGFPIYFLLK